MDCNHILVMRVYIRFIRSHPITATCSFISQQKYQACGLQAGINVMRAKKMAGRETSQNVVIDNYNQRRTS
jgi:hypothetical protein